MVTDWMTDAACGSTSPDLFWPEKGDNKTAREALAVCAECPVRMLCLDYAMSLPEQGGIWGGTTRDDRERLRRQPSNPYPCPHCGDRLSSRQSLGPHVRFRHPELVGRCGTNAGYMRGCKCGGCREAHAAAETARRAL